jgi:hypothetical protein
MLDKAGAVEVHVNIDCARRRNQPFAITHRGAAGDDQARIDAVHDRRIAGLSDADDATVANAEVAFDDPDHGIDDDDIAKQEIQRSLGTGNAGHANPVAQGFTPAVQAFVTVDRVILFNDRRQRGIAEPNLVTRGRTVKCGVVVTVDARHFIKPL